MGLALGADPFSWVWRGEHTGRVVKLFADVFADALEGAPHVRWVFLGS